MTQLKAVFAACAVIFSATLVLQGQTSDNDADLTAIRETAKSYLEAFDHGDAKAVAAHWTENGEYSDQTGTILVGREAIEKAFEEFFAETKGAKLHLHIEALHRPEPGVAIEIGDSAVILADGKVGDQARYKAVHMKQEDGTWKLFSVQEGPPLPPSNYEHLKELEWMIGSWVDEVVEGADPQEPITVYTQARWSVNRNFVVRDFTVTTDHRVLSTGTQHIGWYAPAKQIRSWTFDSDGGITVAIWSKIDDKWVAKSEQILGDGKILKETETVNIDDHHSHAWQLTDRTLDGKAIPDQVVKAHRLGIQPPKP